MNSRKSAIDVSFGRYPGPVWSLLLCVGIGFLNLLANSILPDPDGVDNQGALHMSATVLFLIGVILLTNGPRMSGKALIAITAFMNGLAIILVYLSPEEIEAAVVSFAFIATSIYVAYWLSTRNSMIFITVTLLGYTGALLAAGTFDTAWQLWLVVITSCVFGGLALSLLVERLRTRAMVDPLTGLLNRAGLNILLTLHPQAGRIVEPRTLVVIDLDGFKEINDTNGHLAGDELLKNLAKSWKKNLRPDDVAVRMGGDEFAFILPNTSLSNARILLERLRKAYNAEWSHGETEWAITEDFDTAMARADKALYENKEQRHNKAHQEASYRRVIPQGISFVM